MAKHGVIAKLKQLITGDRKSQSHGRHGRPASHRHARPVHCPDGRWRRFERPDTCHHCGTRFKLKRVGKETYRCQVCHRTTQWRHGDVEW